MSNCVDNALNSLESINEETYIDIIRRIKVRIAKFRDVAEDKYTLFSSKLNKIEEKYNNDCSEYVEAYNENKLTLVCNPENNAFFKTSLLMLEVDINNFEAEYLYLITKKRLEEFIKKLDILYIQVIKKKKQELLTELINDAKEKLTEIGNSNDIDRINELASVKKEELTTLFYKATYLIVKIDIRYNIDDIDISTYFSLEDKTEFVKYLIADVEFINGKFSILSKSHPLYSSIKSKLDYVNVFGYKDPTVIINIKTYWKEFFYVENFLLIGLDQKIVESIEFIDNCLSGNEDVNFLLKWILIYYNQKLNLNDIYCFISLFCKNNILSSIKEKTTKTINDLVDIAKNNSVVISASSNIKEKYYFLVPVEKSYLNSAEKALRSVGISYKIKQSNFEVYEIYILKRYVKDVEAIVS